MDAAHLARELRAVDGAAVLCCFGDARAAATRLAVAAASRQRVRAEREGGREERRASRARRAVGRGGAAETPGVACACRSGSTGVRTDKRPNAYSIPQESGPWSSPTARSRRLLGRGPDRDRPVRRVAAPAVERRRARRPLLPRLPQLALPVHQREGGAGGPDRAASRSTATSRSSSTPASSCSARRSSACRLPDDLVARLEGKSSLGRLGLLIHSTAGFIDPGWDGHVTLELSNVANLPITIYPG